MFRHPNQNVPSFQTKYLGVLPGMTGHFSAITALFFPFPHSLSLSEGFRRDKCPAFTFKSPLEERKITRCGSEKTAFPQHSESKPDISASQRHTLPNDARLYTVCRKDYAASCFPLKESAISFLNFRQYGIRLSSLRIGAS